MLSQLLGVGSAIVRVSADLDFTSLERTATRLRPGGKSSHARRNPLRLRKREVKRTVGGVSGIESHLQTGARRNSTTPMSAK